MANDLLANTTGDIQIYTTGGYWSTHIGAEDTVDYRVERTMIFGEHVTIYISKRLGDDLVDATALFLQQVMQKQTSEIEKFAAQFTSSITIKGSLGMIRFAQIETSQAELKNLTNNRRYDQNGNTNQTN